MIVLDTSFLVAWFNEQDSQHAQAASAMKQFLAGEWGRGLLLEYVYLELVTVLLVRRDHATAARVGSILLESRELEFVTCSEFFQESVAAFNGQTGRLSFADVAIKVVARKRAEGQVLTFDRELAEDKSLQCFPER